MNVALVHDWLIGMGGGEKVLDALYEVYPGPIYTLLHDKEALEGTPFSNRPIHPSFLQRFPRVRKYYRNMLPLFPFAIERFDLSDYPVILSSSHSVAKGIKTRPGQIHICYCHTPMRYAWDLYDFHLSHLSLPKKVVAKPILKWLRKWDEKTHSRVDHFIANSRCVAKRIEQNYGREATVIYPPVDTHLFQPASQREDYYFTCSRLVPYKRIDLLVEAFKRMPNKKLLIIGDGPEKKRLEAIASANTTFLGAQPFDVLQNYLSKARAFLFAAEEDFGIVSVEAQSAGIPVIAFGKGGSLETVISGETGLFFDQQSPESLIDAIGCFEKIEKDFDQQIITKHAEKFSKARFQKELRMFVTKYVC